MDAFEHIVSRIFENRGYWVRVGYKVELSAAEKRKLGNPNMPRPEIDVLAYKPEARELLLIECKGFASGVDYKSLSDPQSRNAYRFRLFHKKALYNAVVNQLKQQLTSENSLAEGKCLVKLCLVPAAIKGGDEGKLRALFAKKGWGFYTPQWLLKELKSFNERGYENDVVTFVVKLLENPKV
jgi:hypothetical protein